MGVPKQRREKEAEEYFPQKVTKSILNLMKKLVCIYKELNKLHMRFIPKHIIEKQSKVSYREWVLNAAEKTKQNKKDPYLSHIGTFNKIKRWLLSRNHGWQESVGWHSLCSERKKNGKQEYCVQQNYLSKMK